MHKCWNALVELSIKINTSHPCSCLAFSRCSKAESSRSGVQFATSGFQKHCAMKGVGDAYSGFFQILADAVTVVWFFPLSFLIFCISFKDIKYLFIKRVSSFPEHSSERKGWIPLIKYMRCFPCIELLLFWFFFFIFLNCLQFVAVIFSFFFLHTFIFPLSKEQP